MMHNSGKNIRAESILGKDTDLTTAWMSSRLTLEGRPFLLVNGAEKVVMFYKLPLCWGWWGCKFEPVLGW